MTKSKTRGAVDDVLLKISMWPFAITTVSLPGVSLAVCFITAFIFRFEDVNETMCEVKNFIPSISAVTGITPQAYIWRTGIALHSAPRFAVSVIHYNHYMSRLHLIPSQRVSLFKLLVRINFWLNFVENSCLVLVAYITNRENYPLHEKIFVVFMFTSLFYMLLNTILFKWTRNKVMTELEQRSYWWKKLMFVSIFTATAGLIFFFILHRIYCVVGAFSMFSVCEYVIGYTNMGYHFTAYLDFKEKQIIMGTFYPEGSITNGTSVSAEVTNNNRLKQKHH